MHNFKASISKLLYKLHYKSVHAHPIKNIYIVNCKIS